MKNTIQPEIFHRLGFSVLGSRYIVGCEFKKAHLRSVRFSLPSSVQYLQYVVDKCFRKIFEIKLKETVKECMREFNVSTVNEVIDARKRKFLAKYSVSENSLCQVFARVGNLR